VTGEGSYRFATSQGKTFMRMYSSRPGVEPITVEYTQSGGQLSLRQADTDTWNVMAKNPAAVTLSDADTGRTVDVAANAEIVVRLPANATTGYAWQVTQTDKILGQPFLAYAATSGATGGGGFATLTWTTTRAVDVLGPHPIKLAYLRGGSGTPAQTFEVTVDVKPAP